MNTPWSGDTAIGTLTDEFREHLRNTAAAAVFAYMVKVLCYEKEKASTEDVRKG